MTKNVAEGRRLIEAAGDAGDRLGQRLAAIGYITGEFGAFDPIKARDLLRQASQAGDAPAMLFYAHMLDGGLARPRRPRRRGRSAAPRGDRRTDRRAGALGILALAQ